MRPPTEQSTTSRLKSKPFSNRSTQISGKPTLSAMMESVRDLLSEWTRIPKLSSDSQITQPLTPRCIYTARSVSHDRFHIDGVGSNKYRSYTVRSVNCRTYQLSLVGMIDLTSTQTCSADKPEQMDGPKIQLSLANIRTIIIQMHSLAERFGIMIMQLVIPLRSKCWLSASLMFRLCFKVVNCLCIWLANIFSKRILWSKRILYLE